MATSHDADAMLVRALKDPSAVFESPGHVARDPRLSREYKLRILERWETDARLLQMATEENMSSNGGEDGTLLQRVLLAVDELSCESDARSPKRPG